MYQHFLVLNEHHSILAIITFNYDVCNGTTLLKELKRKNYINISDKDLNNCEIKIFGTAEEQNQYIIIQEKTTQKFILKLEPQFNI